MAKQRQIDQKMTANKCNKEEPTHDVDENPRTVTELKLGSPGGLADPQDLTGRLSRLL
jgi:hypothetical protein